MAARLHRDEDGIALVMTIGISGIALALVATVLVASISVLRATRLDVAWQAALAAAEAGVDDYLFRINTNPYYWEQAPTLPDLDADPSNDIVNPEADAANLAYSQFVPVPGADNEARFTYTVEPLVRYDGTIRITSTGSVGARTRTVRVVLKRDSFLNYVYFDDIETRDPDQYETWPSSDEDAEYIDDDGAIPVASGADAVRIAEQECAQYRYSDVATPRHTPQLGVTWDGRNPDCHEPHWTSDVFDGPFHSNDMIALRGATTQFPKTPVTTSWGVDDGDPDTPIVPPGKGYLDVNREINGSGTAATPRFPYTPNRPGYRAPLELPPANTEIRDAAVLGGYLFTGPTRVILRGERLYVDSPLSPLADSGEADDGNLLDGNGRADLPLPSNGVVYIQNYTGPSLDCTGRRPPLGGTTAFGAAVPDYLSGMYPADRPEDHDITVYGCSDGDAFVEGELQGRLTVAAQHDVVVTWHIGYASSPRDSSQYSGYALVNAPPPASSGTKVLAPPVGDRDLLGLVADGSVKLFRPTRCLAQRYGVCQHGNAILFHPTGPGIRSRTTNNLSIYAAILSTRHSLRANHQMLGGSGGRLSIHGSVAQRFRGNLGSATGNTLPLNDPSVTPMLTSCSSSYVDVGRTVQTLESGPSGTCRTIGGYGKTFGYDDRLAYLAPPSFLNPVNVSWVSATFEERRLPADHGSRPGRP